MTIKPTRLDDLISSNKRGREIEKEIQEALTKAFNEILKHPEIKKFKSVYALEIAAGLGQASIANAKKHQRPSFPTIVKLCRLAGVRAHKLLGEL